MGVTALGSGVERGKVGAAVEKRRWPFEKEREDPKLWNCGADVVNEIVVHDSIAHYGRHGIRIRVACAC